MRFLWKGFVPKMFESHSSKKNHPFQDKTKATSLSSQWEDPELGPVPVVKWNWEIPINLKVLICKSEIVLTASLAKHASDHPDLSLDISKSLKAFSLL